MEEEGNIYLGIIRQCVCAYMFLYGYLCRICILYYITQYYAILCYIYKDMQYIFFTYITILWSVYMSYINMGTYKSCMLMDICVAIFDYMIFTN